ncbi:MAG: hypothetical protein KAJ86_02135 [Alphaproteobacteria bacterium]|nr:hypothetical protein [Alphaproteobacteria bacterium]
MSKKDDGYNWPQAFKNAAFPVGVSMYLANSPSSGEISNSFDAIASGILLSVAFYAFSIDLETQVKPKKNEDKLSADTPDENNIKETITSPTNE